MNSIVLGVLLLAFVGVHTVSSAYAYWHARQCKSQTEPCISLKCSGGSSGSFPYSVHYGCCKTRIFNQKNYVCVSNGRSIFLKSCNPCTQFRCKSGQCVLSAWKCNGVKDCKDGTDEFGCGRCRSYNFRCKNRRCISGHRVCNKQNDCGDGSDEIGCTRKDGTSCGAGSFRCSNDKCVPFSWACDRYNDCGDSSDERGCKRYGKRQLTAADDDDDENEKRGKKKGKVGVPKGPDAAADTVKS